MIKKRKKQSSERKKSNYVDNAKLLAEVLRYQQLIKDANGEFVKVTDELATFFMIMAKNLSSKGNFISYTWKEDMISDGLEDCIRSAHKFNATKGLNAFTYFSTIMFWAFVRRIKKENKQVYCKYKSFLTSPLMNEDEILTMFQTHDSLKENKLQFVQNFEDTLVKTRVANKKKREDKLSEKCN